MYVAAIFGDHGLNPGPEPDWANFCLFADWLFWAVFIYYRSSPNFCAAFSHCNRRLCTHFGKPHVGLPFGRFFHKRI
jgi:hypothetical protein